MEWYQAVIVFAVAFAVAYCMVPVSKKIGSVLSTTRGIVV